MVSTSHSLLLILQKIPCMVKGLKYLADLKHKDKQVR